MICPYCDHRESKVIDSRDSKNGFAIRRRRECLTCKRRFTTYEKIAEIPYMVVKKDGRRQRFSSENLLRGILRACEKRPVPLSELEGIVEEVENILQERPEKEIGAAEIGKYVMDKLRTLDKVAYVGNDVNDIACIEAVGVGVAVADAHPMVIAVADIVMQATGGSGAVREVAD
ncbi:MAG: transcriptional regulator NrdR, partial [Candidatus Aminicenantaceae bacterium]